MKARILSVTAILAPLAWIVFSVFQYNSGDYKIFSLLSVLYGCVLLYSIASALIILKKKASKSLLLLPALNSIAGLVLLLNPHLIQDIWQFYLSALFLMLSIAIRLATNIERIGKTILNVTTTYFIALLLFEISYPMAYTTGVLLLLISLWFCITGIFQSKTS